jgi:hypothetical protein
LTWILWSWWLVLLNRRSWTYHFTNHPDREQYDKNADNKKKRNPQRAENPPPRPRNVPSKLEANKQDS